MNSVSVRAILLAVSLLAAGCNGGEGRGSGSGPAGPPFAGDGPLRGILIAADITNDGVPVEPGLERSSSDPQVTAIAPLGDGAEGILTVAWYQAVGLDGRELLFEHEIQAKPFTNAYSIAESQGSLQPGLYEVVATLGDSSVWTPWIVRERGPQPVELTSTGTGPTARLNLIGAQPQRPAGSGFGTLPWDDMASFPEGPEFPFDEEDWGTEGGKSGTCELTVFGVPMGPVLEAHASDGGCDEDIVLAAAAGGELEELGRGPKFVQQMFHPCELSGGSDLPGTVIQLAGYTVEPESEVVSVSFELFDPGFNPTGFIRGTPGPLARVKPGQRIRLIALGIQLPLPTAPAIRRLTLRGPDGDVIATKEFEGESCDFARFFRALTGTYRVPEDPPPIIDITLEVEDDAGRTSQTMARYFTAGEIWKGKVKSKTLWGIGSLGCPGGCPGKYTGTLNLAVGSEGTVTGNLRVTGTEYSTHPIRVPCHTNFFEFSVQGRREEDRFVLTFKGVETGGKVCPGFLANHAGNNPGVTHVIPIIGPGLAEGEATVDWPGGAGHSQNKYRLRCKICEGE